jgi:hypothetical protein
MAAGDARMEEFMALVQAIVCGAGASARTMLRVWPHLAKQRAAYGAARQTEGEYFYKEILHYMCEADTALYMAAAA